MPCTLLFIAFITLCVCFVGIRGIYVNTEDPNEFYSFSATDYEYHTRSSGREVVEKGSWKIRDTKIIFTKKDAKLGNVSNAVDFNWLDDNSFKLKDSKVETLFERKNVIAYKDVITKVQVKFDVNGGKLANVGNLSKTVKVGDSYGKAVDNPTREGYVFAGWYPTVKGYKDRVPLAFAAGNRIWSDVTYYANWKKDVEERIDFDFGDGLFGEPVFANVGDEITLPSSTEREGYEFIAWEYNGERYRPGDKITVAEDAGAVVALWGAQNIVSFDVGELDVDTPDSFTGAAGKSYVLPILAVKEDNKFFAGWSADGGETYTQYFDRYVMPEKAVTLTPVITDYEIGLNYTELDDGTYEVSAKSALQNNRYTIKIPAKYKGKAVTVISENAFTDVNWLAGIVIPESVTRIGKDAFVHNRGLENIKVADGNKIYHSAGNCLIETASKTLILGCNTSIIPTDGSVKKIGDNVFYACYRLTSITIPDSVTYIGNSAFSRCSGLTSITIPNSVTSIGDWAFSRCSGLTTINCRAASKPSGWDSDWNITKVNGSYIHIPVEWGYKG